MARSRVAMLAVLACLGIGHATAAHAQSAASAAAMTDGQATQAAEQPATNQAQRPAAQSATRQSGSNTAQPDSLPARYAAGAAAITPSSAQAAQDMQVDQNANQPAPAGDQQIVIEPGDLVSIAVFDAPELSQDVRVASNGKANLALLGDTTVKGLAPDQLARDMEAELKGRKLISNPHVSVTIKEFTTQGITVEGDVQKAGVYPVYSPRLLVDVVAMANGLSPTADTHVTIRRANGKTETANLSQNDGHSLASNSVKVYPGDTVIVPRANFAYVVGDVARPGGYIMRDNGSMTVLQAISEAQGTTRTSSTKKCILLRRSDSGTTRIPINLSAIYKGKEPDVALQNEDILFVPVSGLKSFAQDTQGVVASVSGAALYTFAP